MSTRRIPLSSNPNAANSPYRAVPPVLQKQKRSYATLQREEPYGQPPPKRQMIEAQYVSRSPSKPLSTRDVEGRVFTKKSNGAQTTDFERKLQAARVRPAQQSVITRAEKHSEESLESIRNWQRHYRRAIPKFVFYFDSASEDVKSRLSRQLTALGAREEKFFSNEVTHVVTTRPIPAPSAPSPLEEDAPIHDLHSQSSSHQIQTINPLLLDRSSESAAAQFDGIAKRFTFEVPLARQATAHQQQVDVRRQQVRTADVLVKAQDLGMKIWTVDKLQRMMHAMFDTDAGARQSVHGHNTRSNAGTNESVSQLRNVRNADLSQLLRNERIHGPADRDPTVASRDMIIFKGPFIYIRDIDEKQRPIMVREYAKAANKEDGDWPQFRSVANGKCPFVEEVDHTRREEEREVVRRQRQAEREKEKSALAATAAPRATRATTAMAENQMQPPRTKSRLALSQIENLSTAIADPIIRSEKQPSMPEPPSARGNAFVSRAAQGRLFGGEPVASGMQQSTITSAIQSQMISSTAAVPGGKAGTSKEVHDLQRKVLERNSTASGPTSLGLTSSHRMTDIAGQVARDERANPLTRKNTKDRLGFHGENPTAIEMDEAKRHEAEQKQRALQKRKSQKRDPKPGYCENYMDKFDDFEEHIQSRKHRKFAEKRENWLELDALLGQLVRPLKDAEPDDY